MRKEEFDSLYVDKNVAIRFSDYNSALYFLKLADKFGYCSTYSYDWLYDVYETYKTDIMFLIDNISLYPRFGFTSELIGWHTTDNYTIIDFKTICYKEYR